MKKIVFGGAILLASFSFTSCYNTKVFCGDTTKQTPVVKVNSEWNHHLLYGLIPLNNAKMEAKEYVGNKESYVVKTNQTFVNMLVNAITLGLYTPTTTTYYLPIDDIGK